MRDYWFVCVKSGQSVGPSVYHLMLISLHHHWPAQTNGRSYCELIGWLGQLLLFTGALVVRRPGDLETWVPVCKIETFLTLIVILIVSLTGLTTGVRVESSSVSTGLWWLPPPPPPPPPPTTTGYRLTTDPGDLRVGWVWLVFVTAARLMTIWHYQYRLTTSYRSQLVQEKILEHPPLSPLTHLT